MSNNVNLTIDGQSVTVPAGATIWEAARKLSIHIPVLCHHPDVTPFAGCRVCVVEVEGMRAMAAACACPVSEGMVVRTNTAKVREARRLVVELLLASHPHDCLTCDRNQDCELQYLALQMGVKKIRFKNTKPQLPLDADNPSLVRDPNKCVLCGRCVRTCSDNQTVSAYTFAKRGFDTTVTPAFGKGLHEIKCTFCGQCSVICPVGAIVVKDDTEKVLEAINDPDKVVVVQTAPAVRVALGELFGGQTGAIVTQKMVAALKMLGFDRVLDTNFTADLTIIEEATEFLDRLTKNIDMPVLTSCSPGWINFLEMFYPELVKHHSSCKSPQQMFGALAKTFYAEKEKLDPAKIVSVSIMPCTAKKFEATRPEMRSSGYQDVDYVLTTRELGKLIKSAGICLSDIQPQNYDPFMGVGTGAATIFGNTGGVMEAALRTAYEKVSGETLPQLDFTAVRGLAGIKEAEVDLKKAKIKVAVAHGLGNARKVLDSIKAGNPNKWQFIEIMACPGGCISGGGQPINPDSAYRSKRADGLYEDDRTLKYRKSHENPEITAIYADYLGEPGGEKAHKLLHSHSVHGHK